MFDRRDTTRWGVVSLAGLIAGLHFHIMWLTVVGAVILLVCFASEQLREGE